MKPSKRKRRIQAIKARLKEYYHLKEKNNYFKRNFIELTRHPADYSLFMDNKSIERGRGHGNFSVAGNETGGTL